mgnify:FL=1
MHTSFDGLVTFTDLNDANGGATLIHGSNIITGSVTLDSLKSSSSYTYGSNGTFTLGSGSTYYGYNTVGYFKSTSLSGIALGARSIGHVSFVSSTAIETDSSYIPAAGIFTTTWGDDL